jgi:hypothetical protein
MARGFVAVCVGVLVVAACSSRGPALERGFRNRAEGWAVRYPDGWRLELRNPTAVTNPVFCFDLAGAVDSTHVLVRVVEYEPPELTRDALPAIPRRPLHFRLASLRPSEGDWTRGGALSFRQHRRAIFVGVEPARPGGTARRTVERILESLRLARRGHCHGAAFER